MRVMVTGAAGFIGRVLLDRLARSGHDAVALLHRRPLLDPPRNVVATRAVGSLREVADDASLFAGVDAIVHLSACVHAPRAHASQYDAVNVTDTLALAQAAVRHGVRHLLYASTLKVHGEFSSCDAAGRPHRFSESDRPAPSGAYARSKWQAEQGLRRIESESDLVVTVFRPPLVYGPGVRANFLWLMRAVDNGWPLPLGGLTNRRSLVYAGNLADAMVTAIEHAAMPGATYLVTDGDDVSTSELIVRIAAALQRSPRMLPCPVRLLRACAQATATTAQIERLLGSFVAASNHIARDLHWRPPHGMAEGLEATARWYRSRR